MIHIMHHLRRSIRFTFEKETEVKGVSGYKYTLDSALVDNSLPENQCFNPYPDQDKFNPVQFYSGLMNVSTCKYDSPAYVSYPHFLHGSPQLVDQFQTGSLNPSKDKHESYIILEPLSGVPLEVGIRLQINTLMRPLTRFYDDQIHTFNIT